MSDEVAELKSQIHEIEVQLSGRKPVEELVKIFIYFLIAISVVVGLFGIKQFSDIQELIAAEVKLQLPRDQQRYLEYSALVEETEQTSREFDSLFGKYEVALRNFANLDKVTDDFDIEGKIERLKDESTERTVRNDGSILDEEWRLDAISSLRVLALVQSKRQFDSDFIFNAAQAASRLHQEELAFELMKNAYEKRPIDEPIKAGMLSAQVDIGTEAEAETAFKGLMSMIPNLSPNSPHIVLAEAFNAAEDTRRYVEFIDAIDLLIARPSAFVPSYVYFKKAQAYLRASRKGDVELAAESLKIGRAVLADESVLSVWYKSAFDLSNSVEGLIEDSRLRSDALRSNQ